MGIWLIKSYIEAKGDGMLENEAKVLEYFRRKYLRQAFVVFCICGSVIFLGCWFVEDFWLRALLIFGPFTVLYLMMRALREDLQSRGESLILMKKEEIFPKLDFDFGRGMDERVFDKQNVVSEYRIRECFNVMKGGNFILEEDWFYTPVSSRFLSISSTVFEGVVLAVFASSVPELEGEIKIVKGKTVFSGALAPFLKALGTDLEIAELIRFFGVNKFSVVGNDGRIYFWIKTKTRIFYQFSLIRANSLGMFVKRIEKLKQMIENIFRFA